MPGARRPPPGARPSAIDVTLVGRAGRDSPGTSTRWPPRSPAWVGLAADRVNVKASTGNLAGFEGAGRGISARAVAVVVPPARSGPS